MAVSADVLDVEHLRGLRDLGGADGDAFMADLVRAFETETTEEIGQIRAAVAATDAAALVQAAHRLKGSALNLGCPAIARTAGELEALGRSATTGSAAPLLERLEAEFDATLDALRSESEAA
jgi:HPt (histidine-containing phosphotransfer) domain-containing protein